ncbi:MAG: cyclic nucleotide-binding domain-containing protein [Actinobacteria bacterium]|nr:cyclic nucleotide-binding domain-containing protein [Actinomycetota bacterium]
MDPKRLRSVPLVEGLSKKEIERLSRMMDEVDLPEGKELATEGEFAYEFFIIEKGTASVTRGGRRVRELSPGDFFGEIGLLESEQRTASVVTSSPMTAIVMTGRDFRTMEEELPRVAQQIRERIRERLASDREGE